ncbi:hypothetical protein OG339_06735 [Streptosporangium sp. NBC_01495]|uniref:hypothetical protein n=1 Tax=Streptosporangium sp. NBC_01495 TaxID=2903899 RepID=UPI002E30678F|nr:hypothetical protein [Streptosporangium sp. NBC_01495]
MTLRAIYPALRAVEHATALAGVRPLRLFPVLWPLWQVEITANVYDEEAYEVVDRFLVRAVVEGGIDRPRELAAFFGLPLSLVERCLAFLAAIGHIAEVDGRIRLTELGSRSAQAGVRFVPKESRQKLLIERFTGRPLPRSHYRGSLPVLTSPQMPPEMATDRTRFLPLFVTVPFQARIVSDLAARPDRTEYNLPDQLREIRKVEEQDAYLPAYLIETGDRSLLAYTAIGPERDGFLEDVCRDVPAIHARIDAEDRVDPRRLWTEWLAGGKLGPGLLRQLPRGLWRATFGSSTFSGPPRLPLSRLGSFQLYRHHFLQLWCDDDSLRLRAVKERALGMARLREVRTQADLSTRIAALAGQLEVPTPTLADVRSHAERGRSDEHLAHLDALE